MPATATKAKRIALGGIEENVDEFRHRKRGGNNQHTGETIFSPVDAS